MADLRRDVLSIKPCCQHILEEEKAQGTGSGLQVFRFAWIEPEGYANLGSYCQFTGFHLFSTWVRWTDSPNQLCSELEYESQKLPSQATLIGSLAIQLALPQMGIVTHTFKI